MAHVIQVLGAREIRDALRKANVSLGTQVRKGLMKAGRLLQRYSQEVVPIDTGALKESADTRAFGAGWGTDVVVYYTQHYAVYVHEMTQLSHKAGKQAKFLEGPARIHRDELLKAIAGEAADL